MPKDDCFVPCDTDVLLNKDVINPRSDKNQPVNINARKILTRRIPISAPV